MLRKLNIGESNRSSQYHNGRRGYSRRRMYEAAENIDIYDVNDWKKVGSDKIVEGSFDSADNKVYFRDLYDIDFWYSPSTKSYAFYYWPANKHLSRYDLKDDTYADFDDRVAPFSWTNGSFAEFKNFVNDFFISDDDEVNFILSDLDKVRKNPASYGFDDYWDSDRPITGKDIIYVG